MCDLLILVYGIQFDLEALFEFTQDVLNAFQGASDTCPDDPLSAMDFFWLIQYNEQATRIAQAQEDTGAVAELVGDYVSGSGKWLVTVITSMLMSWCVNGPITMFVKAIWGTYSWTVTFSLVAHGI